MKKLLAKIRKILHDRRTRRFLTRFVSGIAAIVVFITTYALVLPAITMEKEANCGIEAHQHDDSCYTEELICDIPESEGHHHDESCYRTKLNLICETAEHEHSVENGCYDDEGNLICERKEHRHGDECYEEVKELTCEIPESDGHQHSEECYEKVLTCGKEVHVHSISCYEEEPVSDTAVAASTNSAAAATTSAGSVSSAGMTLLFEDKADLAADNPAPVDNADTPDNDTVIDNDDTADNGGTGATTSSTTADQYIPPLDAIDFSAVLNNHTGIYYHSVADGETVEDSSVIPAEEWNRIPNNTDHMDDMDDIELGTNDLLRVYLSYTIPAGSLNTTNPTARYRLPSNLHLTDRQVKAINENANGIAGQYIDMSTLEIKDPDKYNASLGLEAVEGTRRPDESVEDYLIDQAKKTGTDAADATEYISAIVRVENVYDTDGVYGDKGAYLGQDLIFTFTPYSIEKNQHEYDSDGQPTKAGEKIKGWLALDLNMGQVDFDNNAVDKEDSLTEKSDGEAGNTQNQIVTIKHTKRTAEIVFVEEGMDEKDNKIDQISTSLTMAEETVANVQDGDALEDDEKVSEPADQIIMPAMSFNDSIKVSTGRPAGIDKDAEGTLAEAAESLPEEAKVSVRVEADEGTFPAGTTMVLSAVDQSSIDALAETLAETVEKEDPSDTDTSGSKADDEKEESDNTEDKEKNQKEGQKNSNTKTYGFQAVDITFLDKDGNEIEPAKPVRVALTSALVEQAREKVEDSAIAAPVVVHVDNDGNAEQMDLVSPEEVEPAKGRNEEELIEEAEQPVESDKAGNTDEGADAAPDNSTDNKDTAAVEENGENAGTTEFTADSFSVYAIVYTVELYTNVITDSGETYRISVTYDETSGIPQDAELKVKEIKEGDKGYKDYYTEAVKAASESSSDSTDAHNDVSINNKDGKRVDPDKTYARFFDIEIWANGEKIEPAGDVSVSIRLLDVPETDDGNVIKIVHFAKDDTEIIPYTTGKDDAESTDSAEDQNNRQTENDSNSAMEFNFTASSFSVYSVVSYTVDFYWEVNGKLYEFNIPGGGFVSLQQLVEVLGIVENPDLNDKADEQGINDDTEETKSDSKNTNEPGEAENGIAEQKNSEGAETIEKRALTLDDVVVSDETRTFVADIETVTFSTPNLLWVGKTDEATTVGELKEANELEVQYSAELTDDQIKKINNTEVESGDWALISMQPFTTDESLTITMKDGQVFTIRVTDDQASDPLGLNGENFVITALEILYHDNGVERARNYPASLKGNTYQLSVQTESIAVYNNNPESKWYFEYDEDAFDGIGGYYIYVLVNDTKYYFNVTNGQMALTTTKSVPEGEEPQEGTLYASPLNIKYSTETLSYRVSAVADGNSAYLTYDNNIFQISDTISEKNQLAFRNPAGPSDKPGKVGTWDIKSDGIKLKLFDYSGKLANREITGGNYWNPVYGPWYSTNNDIDSSYGPDDLNKLREGYGINYHRSLLFSGGGIENAANNEYWNKWTGEKPNGARFYSGKARQEIVKHNLDSEWFPVLKNIVAGTMDANDGGSLKYLFDDNSIPSGNAKTAYLGDTDANGNNGLKGLFRKDDQGYYYYDSEQNYAYLDPDTNQKEIILYSDTFRKGTSSRDVKTEKIGFFPFNDYNKSNTEEQGPKNNLAYNHQFGMSMSTSFVYPKNGIVPETNLPMTFEFSGDDDVWVFVDGVLVLDLGGVHQPISGKINFSDGTVKITEFGSDGYEYESEKSTTIQEMFRLASQEKYNNDTSIKFNDDDFSEHRLDFFYIERGGCDSNCKIKFNLLLMTTLTMGKQVNGLTPTERQKYLNDVFNYEIATKHNHDGVQLHNNNDSYWANNTWRSGFETYKTENQAATDTENNFTIRTEKNGTQTIGEPIADGQFNLKDGERLTVTHLPKSDLYYVAEEVTGVLNQFETPHAERLYVNGASSSIHEEETRLHFSKAIGDGNLNDWETRAYKAGDTNELTYTNTIREKNLTVRKVWDDHADHSNDSVKFKLVATVDGEKYETVTGHNTINAQRTETTKSGNASTTSTYTENVYVGGNGKQYTLRAANNWTIDFEHLPGMTDNATDEGKEIIYSVEEIIPENFEYSVTYTQPADTGDMYLDLYKFWPDGNENHDGHTETDSNGNPDVKKVEDIDTYVRRSDGMYVIASRDTNGEYIYSGVTDNKAQATQFHLTSKTQAFNQNLSTNDQQEMFDYAARINKVPRTNDAEENPVTYSYEPVQETDNDPNTKGLVMFARPRQETEIHNKKGYIQVEKEWLDEDSNKLEDHPEKIQYTVYRLRHDHEWATLTNPEDVLHNNAEPTWDYDTQVSDGWYTIREPKVLEGGELVNGLQMRVCRFASCNHYTETREKLFEPCTEHDFGEWVVTKAPTCLENGVETHTCKNCGAKETRTTDALGHRYTETIITPLDCEVDGVVEHTCSRCGDTYTEVQEHTGHKWGEWHQEGNKNVCICENNTNHRKEVEITNVYPGTSDLYLWDMEDVWPTWQPHGEGDNWKNDEKQITRSGIFKYNNKYYVIYGEGTQNYYQWPSNPQDYENWIVEVKGSVKDASTIYGNKTWMETNQVPKGTIVRGTDGNYYVRLRTETWSGPPPVKMDHWYRIPDYEGPTVPTNGFHSPAPNSLNPLNNGLPNSLSPEDDDNKGNLPLGADKGGGEEPARNAGGGHGPARGIPAKTNLTLSGLLSALNLTGLGVKNNDTGDTLVAFYSNQQLDTKDDDNYEDEDYTGTRVDDNLWRMGMDVPITDEHGSEYRYYIVENDPVVGGDYKVTYAGQDQGLVNGGTTKITNQIPKYDIEILKVIENTTTPIAGASFTIQKVDVAHITASTVVYEGDASPGDPESTGDDGKTGFKDLTPGIYEIFESDPPDGYVITGDAKFYVKVDSLGVHLLVKKVQNGCVTFEGANTSRVGNVTLSTTDTAITFTVENTPGTELPAAGGSGTLLYSVLGAILIVFAGAALVVRMKRGRFCISDTFW